MISIIIPLYNKEKCIKKTIKSVLNQTYRDFQILIVDDGSTDKSKEIVNSIHDERICYVYKENGGVSSARNLGVRMVKSDWLLFLDADDFLLPNALDSAVGTINSYPNAEIIVGGFLVNENGSKKTFSNTLDGILKNPIRDMFYRKIYSRPGNTFIKNTVYTKMVLFDERFSYNEDWIFGLNLLYKYKVAATTEIFMCYDKTNSTLSAKIPNLADDMIYFIDEFKYPNIYIEAMIYDQYIGAIKMRKGLCDQFSAVQEIRKRFRKYFSLLDFVLYFIMIKYRNLIFKMIRIYN